MSVGIRTSPVPKPKIAPKMVVLSRLLELPSAEVEQVIRDELAENPALEVTESGYCETCGATFSGSDCPVCQGAASSRVRPQPSDEGYLGGSAGWADDETAVLVPGSR